MVKRNLRESTRTVVPITGSSGIVGRAILDELGDRRAYSFAALGVEEHPDPDVETTVASVTEYGEIRSAFDGVDAVIHLAVYSPEFVDENWDRIVDVNVTGTRNVLRAAADAEVESVIFASTNHVVGMYEREFSPNIYDPDFDLTVDRSDPARPDSTYGVSKLFNEHDGRFFVESNAYPEWFYSLRICSVRDPEYDHPYGDAEKGVEDGEWERDSEAYERNVARLKAMWFSRRDLGQMADRMLRDQSVTFDVFYGASDNDARWFDIDRARDVLGYDPVDNGAEWDAPPSS